MSRHRDVRKLNIHDELAEDDVADNYDEEDEMTNEQRGQMATGLAQVRSVLGDQSESGIDDKQIKNALWDSYFDVEGTISWLLDQRAKQAAAAAKKATDHDKAIAAPLSALQRLALQRKQTGTSSTGNSGDKSSSLTGLAKGLSRKAPNSGIQPAPDKPATTSTIPNRSPPLMTSKLSALAQKSLAQRASSTVTTVPPPMSQNVPVKAPLSKLALRIKSQKDAREAASRQPDVDAHKSESVALASKPEFELFDNLRPGSIGNPAPLATVKTNQMHKLRTGPSPFGNILVSKQCTIQMASSIAQIYPGVVSGSPAFQFDTPSPDDAVLAAREGTRLNAYKKASTVIGSRK